MKRTLSNTNDISFLDQISTQEINSYFSVAETPGMHYTYPPQGLFSVEVRNNSRVGIEFENGFGTRIFYFNSEAQEWLEIENRVIYRGPSGEVNDLLPKGIEDLPFDHRSVIIMPYLEGIDLPALVRIYLEGKVEEDGIVKNVGGYVDIQFTSSE